MYSVSKSDKFEVYLIWDAISSSSSAFLYSSNNSRVLASKSFYRAESLL